MACSFPQSDHDQSRMLYIAIGILGATVMPHNLYLHSSIVQSRRYQRTPAGKREAIYMANVDSALALTLALFVNAAILIVAAAVFHGADFLRLPRLRTRTSCSARSWARVSRAHCSRWRCWLRDRTP